MCYCRIQVFISVLFSCTWLLVIVCGSMSISFSLLLFCSIWRESFLCSFSLQCLSPSLYFYRCCLSSSVWLMLKSPSSSVCICLAFFFLRLSVWSMAIITSSWRSVQIFVLCHLWVFPLPVYVCNMIRRHFFFGCDAFFSLSYSPCVQSISCLWGFLCLILLRLFHSAGFLSISWWSAGVDFLCRFTFMRALFFFVPSL